MLLDIEAVDPDVDPEMQAYAQEGGWNQFQFFHSTMLLITCCSGNSSRTFSDSNDCFI